MLERIEKVAKEAVFQAGDLIRRKIGEQKDFGIENKGPSDYVTDIDRRSENLIIQTVQKYFPDHRIVSEEMGEMAIGNDTTWIIDPLDGTTNFIHGFPFVAVSIAVSVKKEVVLGMVLDPVRKELFSARRGEGAFVNGRPIRIRSLLKLEDALVATGFPFRAKHLLTPYLQVFSGVFSKISDVRRAGSAALDLAYLAAGRLDGFWEIGLKPWDVAAGSLLITEAGGKVDDFWGSGNYLLNGHIVAGSNMVHSFLMEQVGKFLASPLTPPLSLKGEGI